MLLSRTTPICNILICNHFWWFRSVVWKKMRKKSVESHVIKRDNVFYYVRHIPKDLIDHYSVKRLCFSLKTKCESLSNRSSRSITQRLDDYWFGIRLKNMDVPAINSLKMSIIVIITYWGSFHYQKFFEDVFTWFFFEYIIISLFS